jgi:hypothetical protein
MEKIPMAFKLGSIEHAKGYIINRLFEDRRIGKKHLPVELLKQGYPPRWRHLISKAFEELRTETPSPLHVEQKRTDRSSSLHVSIVHTRLANVRGLMNGYRTAVGLPKYGLDFKTLLPLPRER